MGGEFDDFKMLIVRDYSDAVEYVGGGGQQVSWAPPLAMS
jgi:hypothetical protein